jgi:large subunit ribosomal protein L21
MPGRLKNNYRNHTLGITIMYAVLVTGGKQYRVMQGERLRVEKLEGDVDSELKFDNILMLGDADGIKLGDDIKGASIAAKIVGHGRADKIRIVKFRRRKHHRKQMGHRQYYTEIEITGINGSGDKTDSKKN